MKIIIEAAAETLFILCSSAIFISGMAYLVSHV